MKPVNQKIINPENGDCFGACVASLFELDEIPKLRRGSWLDVWNEWLEKYNLQVVEYSLGSFPVPVGFAILAVKSALFQGVRHAVVFHGDGYNGKVVHNPNPDDPRGVNIPNEDWLSFKVLALVDPSKTVRR
jgi:hypothetical protein